MRSRSALPLRAVRSAVGCALVAIALAITACDNQPPPKRQIAKIAILPDTPPPPPPPPKELPKPKPPEEAKTMRVEQPKVADSPPPQPTPLKMEGAAGDGPSAFGAGTVTNDYSKGDPVIGAASAGGTGAGTASDRAQERFFANSARQMLRDEIERHLKSDAPMLTAVFSVWFESDGSIRRYELAPTGNAATDSQLDAALAETSRSLKLPPPSGLTQPLRFKLSVRPLG